MPQSASPVRLAWYMAIGFLVTASTSAEAHNVSLPNSNPIVCENQLPGDPASEWDIAGAGDQHSGLRDRYQRQPGADGQLQDRSRLLYRLDIYRMGYYAGMGARKVATSRRRRCRKRSRLVS